MTAKSDPMGHIYLDFHYISICRTKKTHPECCLLHSQDLTVVGKDSQEFPVISQNNSLVIIPCDRQTVCLASNIFCLCSSAWGGWVRGSPRAWEELAPFLEQWCWRGRGCQRQSVREPLLDSSCLGHREKSLRTRRCFLQKETDGRSKAWGQGPAWRDQMKEKLVFNNFNFSLQ